MAEIIYNILSSTAWPMDPPKAYGAFHLSFMLIGFALCGALAWRLRNTRRGGYIILGCSIFLALTEVYKQLFHCIYLWDGSYNWGIFPFHLCSVPMYLGIIAPLLHSGRLQKSIYSFMGCFNLLGGAISFFEPSGLMHSYWTLTLHAFIWHMMLVFMGLFICFSGMAGRETKDYKAAVKIFALLSILAFAFNLAFRKLSDGSLNCFFIGPSDSPIIVFDAISEHLGWYVSTATYIPALCLGAYIMFRLFAVRDILKYKARV